VIRLIALDIDGTLLTSDRRIDAETLAALRRAHAAGCHIVLATGRAFRSLEDVADQLSCADYAITSSGGGVFTAMGEMLFAARMAPELVRAVTETVGRFGLMPEVYIRGQAYASGFQLDNMSGWGVPEKSQGYILNTRVRVEDYTAFVRENLDCIEGMDVLMAPERVRDPLREALGRIGGLSVTSSSPLYADVNTAGVTKATGLAHLGAILGLAPAEMMAFGDAENDVPMLRYAGVGVAMANALPDVQAAADFVTTSNDEGGIAKALAHFGVGEEKLS
jgi:Cof subfamily protein (haloacid dehalogenase superfamily)